jgi:radical SAM superfamily enzyme YgiQ (UPF0313 family)
LDGDFHEDPSCLPQYPETFGVSHALNLSPKACYPIGALNHAALLPEKWQKRLVDMNVQSLSDRDLRWADYVFISAMTIQTESAKKVLARCRQLGVKTVAGGPLFTSNPEEFPEVDHLVLNEAEITLPLFLDDLQTGSTQPIYKADGWANVKHTPIPLWELVDIRNYAAMNIQYSRGCPFDCEFCDITALFGRKPRTKDLDQLLEELDSLYARGWRGGVFFVDDNFISDKELKKRSSAIIAWMEKERIFFIYYRSVH